MCSRTQEVVRVPVEELPLILQSQAHNSVSLVLG